MFYFYFVVFRISHHFRQLLFSQLSSSSYIVASSNLCYISLSSSSYFILSTSSLPCPSTRFRSCSSLGGGAFLAISSCVFVQQWALPSGARSGGGVWWKPWCCWAFIIVTCFVTRLVHYSYILVKYDATQLEKLNDVCMPSSIELWCDWDTGTDQWVVSCDYNQSVLNHS